MTAKKSVFTAIAFMAITGLALSGCGNAQAGSADESNQSVTIVSGQSAQNGDVLKQIFENYNKTATNGKIDLQITADSDVDTAQKVLLNIKSGHGPDAVRVTNATYQTLVDSGAAQPVDSCLADNSNATSKINSDLLDELKIKGKLYQIPWYVTPNALFYNSTLFSQAGLDPNNPPKTMTEFHDAALKISKLGVGGGVAYFGNDFNFQNLVRSLGGNVYDTSTGKLGIDSQQSKQVFQLYMDMAADKSAPIYTNFFTDANEAFASGKLGMMITSASAYPALKAKGKNDIKIAPVPSMDGGSPITATSTNGFVITTKDPTRQKLTCNALMSLITPESVTTTVKATATIPLLPGIVNDDEYLAPVYKENPDWMAVAQQKSFSWASLPGGANAEYTKDYVDTQTAVLNGSVSPEDATKQLQQKADSLLQAK